MNRLHFWIVGLMAFFCTQAAQAQLPATRLDGILPAGGSPGQTVDLTIFGGDLDDVNRLHFSHPGISAKQKIAEPGPFDEGPQPVANRFDVAIKPDVPAGFYNVRCQGKYGLSGPRTFVVDALTGLIETEPNNQPEQANSISALPTVVNGQLNGGADVDWFQFTGQANQRVLVEGFAQRIDSLADLVLRLTTADGRVLGESRQWRAGDPLLDVTLPAAGTYLVRVQDALYRGGGECPYRLKIGSMPMLDFIFPPAGLAGSNEEYTLYGRSLPGGQPAGLTRDGQPLELLKVRIAIPGEAADKLLFSERLEPQQAGLDGIEYRVTSPAGTSNPVLLTVATAPVVREQDNNNAPQTAQKITPPCEIAGQFFPQRDVDWFTFDAKAGEVFWIEVYSHRLGQPTDPMLLVQRVEKKENGEEVLTQIAWVDDVRQREGGFEFDERTHDPAYRFTAPADGVYRVLVRDGYSSVVADPRLAYRLAIRPAQPDFRLAAVPTDASGAVFLRHGGRESVRVVAFRRDGFEGEIRVTASGLPEGVTASEIIIGPASNNAMLVLTANAKAAGKIGQLQLIGKANVAGREVARTARPAHPLSAVPFAQPNNPGQPSLAARLTDSLPVVVSDSETARVVLTLNDPVVVETSRGGVVKFKYSVTRQEGAGGNLIGFPVGLPPNVGLPQVGIGGNNQGEFELRMQSNTPPGAYSFCLAGMMQGMNYSRNPEAAAKAKAQAERVGKILTESQQKTQLAQQTAQQAQNNLNQANVELTQAATGKTTAEQTVAATTAALKTATDAVAAAQKPLETKPDDAGLKQQLETTKKTMEDAAQKAKAATEAFTAAMKKLDEATAKQKTLTEAKTKADQAFQAAQQFQQQAQQAKQQADQTAQQLQQQANPRGFNFILPSTPVTLKIAEYPITLTGPPEKVAVKQGAMLEIPFKVARLYGFDQNVNTQLLPPGNVVGLEIQNGNLAGNQTDGKTLVMAQPTATPGDHPVTFRTTLNFNGQGLTLDRSFVLTVEKVEPAK